MDTSNEVPEKERYVSPIVPFHDGTTLVVGKEALTWYNEDRTVRERRPYTPLEKNLINSLLAIREQFEAPKPPDTLDTIKVRVEKLIQDAVIADVVINIDTKSHLPRATDRYVMVSEVWPRFHRQKE